MHNKLKYNGEFKNDFKQAGELGGLLVEFLNNKIPKDYNIIHSEVLLDETIAQMLDKYSGIDAVMKSKKDVSGVALRIQTHESRNWGTFTIRYSRATGTETEYSKRIRQIYDGHPSFYPHYTCQAYYDNKGVLIGGAICSTKNLYDIVKKYEPFTVRDKIYLQTNKSDGNCFLVVPFDMIEKVMLF